MAIKVIAQRRVLKIGKNPGVKKFVMRPDLYVPIAEKKVFKEASVRSGISEGAMKAAWDAAGEVIKAWATEGHSVPLPGLGTMRFGVRSTAVEELEKVKANLITTRRIIFTPAVEVKDELKNTSIQITCLDEDGTVLKRVTSGDDGEVEDPEGGGNQNENQTQHGNGNGGSGSQTTLTAPTIGGTSPFAESTQVTMSGPSGAEIRYTTDGSTPTSASSLYSAAITLSDTATVKAIAIKDGQTSEVTTKVFTKSSTSGDAD